MLGLIQIITHMRTILEYDYEEIEQCFTAIEQGNLRLDELLNSINLDFQSATSKQLTIEKIGKWRSAMAVVKMRSE